MGNSRASSFVLLLSKIPHPGPPVAPFYRFCFFLRGRVPTKIDYRKNVGILQLRRIRSQISTTEKPSALDLMLWKNWSAPAAAKKQNDDHNYT